MEPVVHLRAAVSLLGRYPALAGVDLDVAAGEIVLLAGPNGAGKTTLLRVCAGLLPVLSGTAHVLGHDLATDRKAVRRRVGLLSHQGGLYDDLTVTDNVRFWARAAGASVKEADAAMDRLHIADRLRDLPVAQLSSGQRRRTAIAAVVSRRPELWLLDEPHAGLDQDARALLEELVAEAVTSGATALVASHELERAGGFAHRMVTLAGGVISPTKGAVGVS